MQKMANANFHDYIKCCPEYVCSCCDQYGIGHLSESERQTNILNVPKRSSKHL